MKNKAFILSLILLFSSHFISAASIVQRGSIEQFSFQTKKMLINIEFNNAKLYMQRFTLDYSRVKVWNNNKQIDIRALKKAMKIEFRSLNGRIFSISVLNNPGS